MVAPDPLGNDHKVFVHCEHHRAFKSMRAGDQHPHSAPERVRRLRELLDERQALVAASSPGGPPPQIDAATVMAYRRQTEKLFSGGDPADRKRLLRMWVQEIKLKPVD
jgi:hypothetical protein